MKQLIKNNKSGKISIEEVPSPKCSSGHLIVKNIFSAISIGTETASIEIAKKNLLEKAKSRPDDLKKVMKSIKENGVMNTYFKVMDRLSLPTPVGYSSVGKVVDKSTEIKDINIGDIVACGGSGHAEIIKVPRNLCVKVPNGTDLESASLATIASIALQGIRQSNCKSGETVLVIGLGLIGQITMKLLDLMGCFPVGIDLSDSAVDMALKENFKAFNRNEESLESKLLGVTKNIGFDSVIITASSDSSDPIELASKLVMDRGHITVVGNIKMDLSRKIFYNKELSLNLSRSYGPGRYDVDYELKGNDYPISYVRWTENRNMELILKYLNQKKLDFSNLISIKHSFDSASKLYEKIRMEKIIGAIFEYDNEIKSDDFIVLRQISSPSKINLGIIGAGNYAQNVILPIISKNKKINLVGLATETGSKSKHLANKYGFSFCTTNSDKIIGHSKINTVMILTRHDTHSKLVLKSIDNNKNIFVEKPLALNIKDLNSIKKSVKESNSRLWVGFNRRFSPHTRKALDFLGKRTTPIAINYRINTGQLDPNHWSNDLQIGGGRIVGECCHFIDFCSFVIGSDPVDYQFSYLDSNNNRLVHNNSISLVIKYADGSISNINYYTNGNSSYPKERIEIFSNQTVIEIDDFKRTKFISDKGNNSFSTRSSEKGHKEQLDTFFNTNENMDFNSLYKISEMTLRL